MAYMVLRMRHVHLDPCSHEWRAVAGPKVQQCGREGVACRRVIWQRYLLGLASRIEPAAGSGCQAGRRGGG